MHNLYKIHVVAAILAIAALPVWGYQIAGVDFHGDISQGYIITDGNNPWGNSTSGSFHDSEATINASKWLNDKLRIGGQVYTYRLGDIGGLNMPQIDWLFADYQLNDNLGFRLGKIKIPSGLYGENLGVDMSRPYALLPESVYRPSWRDFSGGMWGAGAYGTVPLKKAGSLDFNLVTGKVDIRGHSGICDDLSGFGPQNVDKTDNDYSAIGQLIWNTPIDGLRLAGSLWYAHQVDFDGRFKDAAELSLLPPPTSGLASLAGMGLAGANTRMTMPNVYMLVFGPEYLWHHWTFSAEYMRMHTTVYTNVNSALASMVPGGALTGGSSQTMDYDGLYFAASKQITKQLQIGGYYSVFYSNYKDRAGSDLTAEGIPAYEGWQKDLALCARYDITPWWLVKVEGHVMNGTAQIMNYSENAYGNQDHYWLMGVVKTTMYF